MKSFLVFILSVLLYSQAWATGASSDTYTVNEDFGVTMCSWHADNRCRVSGELKTFEAVVAPNKLRTVQFLSDDAYVRVVLHYEKVKTR